MTLAALALLTLRLQVAQPPSTAAAWRWFVGGSAAGAYVVADTAGRPTDADGATATLRASADSGMPISRFVTLGGRLGAEALLGRRVRVSAELRPRAAGTAALWLRVDGARTMIDLANTMTDGPLRGTTDWTARSVVLPVPADAQQVVFGVQLLGGGAVEVRRLRVEVLPAVAADAPLGPAARAELDAAIAIARRHALWRDTVSWAAAESAARARAAGAETAGDAYPAVRLLLARLGDHHSFLMAPRPAPSGPSTARAAASLAENPAPIVRRDRDGVGYVSVPGFAGGDTAAIGAYARRMHTALLEVAPSARCGWIVDLRENTGGNMWPMLAGLRPLLGDSVLGTFAGARAGDRTPWRAAFPGAPPPPSALAPLERAFVAVLTGPRTASSGEAVTASFRGRPRTRSFGNPTRGLSTANRSFPLPDGAVLVLTVSVYEDRTGRRYGEQIVPEEPAADPNDAAQRARAWLTTASGCRAGT